MTEYEAAALAVQQASLAVQQAVLTASYWQTGITLAVSSGLILYGFRIMRVEGRARAQERVGRRAETMTAFEQQRRALEVLIERTAPPQ